MVIKIIPKELYEKSKELYKNIRTIGENGQSSKWAYYYCMCILNGKKDVLHKFSQADAQNVTGQSVNIKLTKKEYLAKMKVYCEWVEKHKALPNYVIIKNKKVNPMIWNAYVGYLFKVYYETGKLPADESIKSNIYKKTAAKKKYGHATSPGCDNRGQNNSVNCGPHSMQEVIRNLTGKVIKQSTLAGWAGTGSGGTDHHGLETAIAKAGKQLGVKFTVKWYNFSDLGWNGINKILKSNNQDCIIHNAYRRTSDFGGYGHYETVNKVYNTYCDVQNSLGDKCSHGCYCGYVEERDLSTFKYYINGISQKSVMVITRVD